MALVASVAYFSLFRSQKSGSGGGRGDGERDATAAADAASDGDESRLSCRRAASLD